MTEKIDFLEEMMFDHLIMSINSGTAESDEEIESLKDWLTSQILKRDEAMRKEGFKGGVESTGIIDTDELVDRNFEDFEKERKARGDGN